MVVFFLLLASCLVAYRRRQRFRLRQTSGPVTATVIAQSQVPAGQTHHTAPGQMVQVREQCIASEKMRSLSIITVRN